LPKHIREQLAGRIDNGEQGKDLVEWLNGLPAVQEVLEEQFAARPISEQNLSEWKQGGYSSSGRACPKGRSAETLSQACRSHPRQVQIKPNQTQSNQIKLNQAEKKN
jgi:hypothetical protein